MNILFVCTGNTCRSPMAEGYFRSICEKAGLRDINVSSAGTMTVNGMSVSQYSVDVLRQCGIDISDSVSTLLTPTIVHQNDFIIVMTSGHQEQVLGMGPGSASKVRKLLDFSSDNDAETDVPDPVGGSFQVYCRCFQLMKKALDNLLLDLKTNHLPGDVTRS